MKDAKDYLYIVSMTSETTTRNGDQSVLCNKIEVNGGLWYDHIGHPNSFVIHNVIPSMNKTLNINSMLDLCSGC